MTRLSGELNFPLTSFKMFPSIKILGNMQAQAPGHVEYVQVGRDHRQLPLELDLPFSS